MVDFSQIDVFGTSVKWKLFKKEKFQSNFGAILTLLFIGFTLFKFLIFINKSCSFGFLKMKTSTSNLNRENVVFKNFTFGCDYERVFKYLNKTDNTNVLEKNPNSVSDILKVEFFDNDHYLTNQKIRFDITYPSQTEIKIILQNKIDNSSTININIEEKNLEDPIFPIEISYTDNLQKLLNYIKRDINLKCYIEYYIYFSSISDFVVKKTLFINTIRSDYSERNYVYLRKLELENKVDFDISEFTINKSNYYDISNQDRFFYKNNDTIKTTRFYYYLEKYKINYEATIFSLDDLLSVLGGFLEIMFFIFEFLSGFYNDHIANRKLNEYCYKKIQNFDGKVEQFSIKLKNQLYDLNKVIGDYNKKLSSSNQSEIIDDLDVENESDYQILEETSMKNKIKSIKNIIPKLNLEDLSNRNLNADNQIELSKVLYKEKISSGLKSYLSENEKNKGNIKEFSIKTNIDKNKNHHPKKRVLQFFWNKKTGKNFLEKIYFIFDKKKKKFLNLDFFDFISIDRFLQMLSGYESLKYFLFDEMNKDNFERLSDLFLFTKNWNDPKVVENNRKNVSKDFKTNFLQIEFLKRFKEFIEVNK